MKQNTVGTTEINACGEFVRPIWQSSLKQESDDPKSLEVQAERVTNDYE